MDNNVYVVFFFFILIFDYDMLKLKELIILILNFEGLILIIMYDKLIFV